MKILIILCILVTSEMCLSQSTDVFSVKDGHVRLENGQAKQLTPVGTILDVGVPNFKSEAAEQELPDWCWATCIQAVLRANNIEISQKEIVEHVKQAVSFDKASAEEINKFFTQGSWLKKSWLKDSRMGAHSNHFDSTFWKHQFNQDFLLRHLGSMRSPAIVSFKKDDGMNHAVVIYKVTVTVGKEVDTVTYFDPETGNSEEILWWDIEGLVTDIWLPYIVNRTF